jgi:hypothetical protein
MATPSAGAAAIESAACHRWCPCQRRRPLQSVFLPSPPQHTSSRAWVRCWQCVAVPKELCALRICSACRCTKGTLARGTGPARVPPRHRPGPQFYSRPAQQGSRVCPVFAGSRGRAAQAIVGWAWCSRLKAPLPVYVKQNS